MRTSAVAALLALSGCQVAGGAAVAHLLPLITAAAGAAAAVGRADIVGLDFIEDIEGRKAIPKSTPNSCLIPTPIVPPASTVPST